MPDPTRQTVSASRAAALFDRSPYTTLFMLYHHLKDGIDIDSVAHERMKWGLALEPLIIEETREYLRMDVDAVDAEQRYVRRGRLGATKDARFYDPDRGPGAVETKCCFDYRIWMDRWLGGVVPADIAIQVQVQMLVGDGEDKPSYDWGLIAVWVCGEITYIEIKPDRELWELLDASSRSLFERIEAGDEPEPFGSSNESALINALYPMTVETKIAEVLGDEELALAVRQYWWARDQRLMAEKIEEQYKPIILHAAGDAKWLYVDGAKVRVTKSTRKPSRAKVHPDVEPAARALIADISEQDVFIHGASESALIEALDAEPPITRQGSTSATLKVIETGPPKPAPVPDQTILDAG